MTEGSPAGELDALPLPELLARLAPTPEPTPISYWPETAAWAWVAAALFGLAIVFGARALRRWRANAYRRAALGELRSLADAPGEQARLLRRTALVAFPRYEVASLIGEDWLRFLDRSLDGSPDRSLDPSAGGGTEGPAAGEARDFDVGEPAFRTDLGRALAAAAYVPDGADATTPDAARTRALVARWIREHRAPGPRSRPTTGGGA